MLFDRCKSLRRERAHSLARLQRSMPNYFRRPPSVGDDGDGVSGGDVRQMILNGQTSFFRKACGMVVGEWADARFFQGRCR